MREEATYGSLSITHIKAVDEIDVEESQTPLFEGGKRENHSSFSVYHKLINFNSFRNLTKHIKKTFNGVSKKGGKTHILCCNNGNNFYDP